MADSAPGSSGTSTSARKPSLPRLTPSTGARCRSASRMARSIVPSPPRLTSRSERRPSSSGVTAIALQCSRTISSLIPRTWVLFCAAQSRTAFTALLGVPLRMQDQSDGVHVSAVQRVSAS